MIATTDEWKRAVRRKNARTRYLAIIEDGTNTWKSFDASHDSLPYRVGMASSPSSVSAELNPLTRESKISEIVVEFRDKYLRPIVVANELKGQAITLKIGAAEIDENDFVYYGSGVIETVIGDGKSGIITLSCLDAFDILRTSKLVGFWIDKHPLQILYFGDGTGVLEAAGIPTSLIDTASFDPSTYTDSISHWNMPRIGFIREIELTLGKRTPALDIVNQIMEMLHGTFYINGEGKFSFKIYDPTVAVVDSWTDAEIISLEPVKHRAEVVNEMTVGFWQPKAERDTGERGLGSKILEWKDTDTDSKSSHGYKGSGTRSYSHGIETQWINGFGRFDGSIVPLPTDLDTTMGIAGYTSFGFTGMLNALPQPQPAWTRVSASRPAYFLIMAIGFPFTEIVKAEGLSPAYSDSSRQGYNDPESGQTLRTLDTFANQMVLTSVTRGVLDTDPVDWDDVVDLLPGWYGSVLIFDITILVALTDTVIKRFGSGVDIINVTTGMGQIDKEIGDFLNLTDTDFVGFENDGLDGSKKYEIISREPAPENGVISFGVATAAANNPTRSQAIRSALETRITELAEAEASADVTIQHVVSGLESSTTGGLVGSLSDGIVCSSPANRQSSPVASITYTASVDSYLFYDPVGRALRKIEVPNLDPAPETPWGTMPIAKVVTDGSGITSHTDLRPLAAMDGVKIVDETITSPKVGPGAVSSYGLKQTTLGSFANSNARFTLRVRN